MDPVKQGTLVSAGECSWGGMASTFFAIDRAENMAMVFMTQLVPSSALDVRRVFRTLVYQALE